MPFDSLPEETKTLTKPDVFSLDGLIAWLEKQPANRKYTYIEGCECLLHQYFTAAGLPVACVYGYAAWRDTSGRLHGDPWKYKEPWQEPLEDVATGHPRTFGAALSRALRLRSAASVRE